VETQSEGTAEARSTGTMRAALQHRYGSGEMLAVVEVPIPSPRADEVVVRVRGAGVSRGAWHLMTGTPYLVRLGTGLRRPRRTVPGLELSGEVVAVGSKVDAIGLGDQVFGFGHGTFAEYAVAKATKLAPKPASLSFVEAAALPDPGTTALQALCDHGGLQSGQRVLVIGASGGVGVHAVQLAAGLGAEVTGVCSGPKAEMVRAAGAHHVVDYTVDDLGDTAARYDLILDIGGNRPVRQLRELLTDRGTLVFVGGEAGGRWFGGMGRPMRSVVRGALRRQRVRMFVAKEQRQHLEAVVAQVEAGLLRPVVDRTFPLDQAGAAIDHLEAGRAAGKLVVVP
jgi:NADPH:quinone reductase-like Zn-dependent oxidoreductase